MDLIDRLAILRDSAEGQHHALDTPKKTETALVLPFFDALGYDPFEVQDVEPDVRVDGDDDAVPVDYVLKKEGDPVMLVQCSAATDDLEVDEDHVLLRHLDTVEADLVVFTNGLRYHFYTDAVGSGAPAAAVFEFDLLGSEPAAVETLRRFTKRAFDPDEVRSASDDRPYDRLVQEYLTRQKDAPDAPFVQFVAAQIHDGDVPDDALDQLRPVVQHALEELAGDAEEELGNVLDREERRVSRNGDPVDHDDRDEPEASGVFDKDIVKRVLDDF